MKGFKDLKVGSKLLTGFISIALITLVVGGFGIAKIKQIDQEDTKLYERITVPLGELAQMSILFQRTRINVRDAVEAGTQEERERYLANLADLRLQIGETADRFEKTIITDDAKASFKEFRKAREVYIAETDRVLALDAAGRKAEAQAVLKGEARQAAQRQQELMDKLMASKKHQGKATSDHNSEVAHHATVVTSILVVLSALLAVALGLAITRQITRPLHQAVSLANRIASGDLSAEVSVDSRDEIGQLQRALNEMVNSLRQLVSQTVAISGGIAAASAQLHATSDQIATGAEEVAAQVGAIATASEEMAATSADIARSCAFAAEASNHSTASASSGAGIVQETINGMRVINDRVQATAQTVEALGARSEQIGEIVGTIEDIADQTNLLALNAAIEAARAGEHGRGFAVVADEVRALAERTTTATKEIGSMIKVIQKETRDAVRAMEEGVREVEKGSASASRSGDALEEIMERIGEAAQQVNQIATAAEEQTATTAEVTANMQQITDVVTQTAHGAEETATAAAQLAGQAGELQTLVARFKLSA